MFQLIKLISAYLRDHHNHIQYPTFQHACYKCWTLYLLHQGKAWTNHKPLGNWDCLKKK